MTSIPASWPKRVPHRFVPPVTSIWHNLRVSAERYPQKAALIYFDQEISYRELAEQVECLAHSLFELGVRPGDRVLLNMQNSPQLVVAHYAILRANAVVVPVNPMGRADELRHFITDSEARVALTTADLAPLVCSASNALDPAQRLRHLVTARIDDTVSAEARRSTAMSPAWLDWFSAVPADVELAGGTVHRWSELMRPGVEPLANTCGGEDMALLPYTSGTTGVPKGCIHSHAALMHNAHGWNMWFGVTPESVALAVVPMFHITGIVAVMHAGVAAGATLVVMPRWDRAVAAHLIRKWRITDWISIPTMVIDLLAGEDTHEIDLSSLTCIGGGGAAMPQAVAQRLLDGFGLRYIEAYGLTETASPSHANPPDHPRQQCLGIPFIGTDVRLINPESLAEVQPGEAGEIVIHGPQIFRGYWKQPEATREAFMEIDGRTYFRTGDIGRVDPDGYFYITDRLKRMINASGFKVWPAEVELLLFKHPAVQEACVIATRDDYRGESVKAVVVLRPGFAGLTAQELANWCREHMAAYKIPRHVAFVDALPRSASGKVLWRVLQEAELSAA